MQFYIPHLDKECCVSWSARTAPCQAACPLGIDVEGYVTAIAREEFDEALEVIRRSCPLPSVCGRVCHHPCEENCTRAVIDEPISIRSLKRFATDSAHDQLPEKISLSKPSSVAIIGSGPAGLTAAHDLLCQGYPVTVFEARPLPGGMLAWGIPEFDLPQELVQREIDYLKALGIEIKTKARLGENISLDDLKKQGYEAVLLATGAWASLTPDIPGIELKGVLHALPFLEAAKSGTQTPLRGKLVVLGGGNVAFDVARTALRNGAAEVHVVCLETREDMPAFSWMVQLAEEEGVNIHPSLALKEVRSADGKRVRSLDLRQVTHFARDDAGRVTFLVDESLKAMTSLETDWVVVAIGQKSEAALLDPNLQVTSTGTLAVNPDTLMTTLKGVFAAGDVVTLPGTVVGSMAAGRKAARSIAAYLAHQEAGRMEHCQPVIAADLRVPEGIPSKKRVEIPLLLPGERVRGFQEVELGLKPEQAVREANRCLKCYACNWCLERVNCVAFESRENKNKKSPVVNGILCAGCGRCARACPYHHIHFELFNA